MPVCVLCGSPERPSPPVVGPLWGPPLCMGPCGWGPPPTHVASTRVVPLARAPAPAVQKRHRQ